MKYISSEFVASSSQRQDLLEAKMASVNAYQEAIGNNQRDMDDNMKSMSSRQDDMGDDLKTVIELLKKKP